MRAARRHRELLQSHLHTEGTGLCQTSTVIDTHRTEQFRLNKWSGVGWRGHSIIGVDHENPLADGTQKKKANLYEDTHYCHDVCAKRITSNHYAGMA